MEKGVKKAILPVAGMGTRFLPATKAQPKEMLPVVDKPVIQYIVEEAVAAGIEDIIFVTALGKRALEDHFDRNFELEYRLEQKKNEQALSEIKAVEKLANFAFVRQRQPLGDGHALLSAAPFIEPGEPVAVLFGDDIIYSPQQPAIGQLIDVFIEKQAPVLALQPVPKEAVSSYGIIAGSAESDRIWKIDQVVEKPDPAEAPSDLSIVGRYILTPEILDILKDQNPDAGGEIRLADAFVTWLNSGRSLYGCCFDGRRYDCGNKLQFIIAQIELGLVHPELNGDLRRYLNKTLNCQVDEQN